MSSAAKNKANRPSKREVIVIDDDESINEQPVLKKLKREEETVPSSQVVELQQEVLKLKDKFQRACREARKEQLRAEAAESRLDSKYGIRDNFNAEKKRADDLEKSLAEVSLELEEARGRAENASNSNSSKVVELQQEVLKWKDRFQGASRAARAAQLRAEGAESRIDSKNGIEDDLKSEKKRAEELEKSLAEVSSQLVEARRRAVNANVEKIELARENEGLKSELADRKSLLETERQQANDNQTRDRARIDELEQKLTQYEEKSQHQKKSAVQTRSGSAATASNDVSPKKAKKKALHTNCHPNNLFQLCDPDSSDAISYESACKKLFSAAEKHEGESINEQLMDWFSNKQQLKACVKNLHCEACNKFLNHEMVIVQHFLSSAHTDKVSALGASVSRAAIEYWVDKLQPVPAAKPKKKQLKPAITETN